MDPFEVILGLVSMIFSAWLSARSFIVHLWRMKDFSFHRLFVWLYDALVRRKRIVLEKNSIPRHVAIILGESEPYLDEVAELISCAVRYDVRKVSVYDPLDMLADKDDVLSNLIADKLRWKYPFSLNDRIFVKCASSDKKRNIVDVRLFNYRSGRRSLVEAARNLASVDKPTVVDAVAVDRALSTTKHLSEVDLLLKFGTVDSVLAFPPTCLTITELIYLPTLKHFDEMMFVECLVKFSSRDRRHGK